MSDRSSPVNGRLNGTNSAMNSSRLESGGTRKRDYMDDVLRRKAEAEKAMAARRAVIIAEQNEKQRRINEHREQEKRDRARQNAEKELRRQKEALDRRQAYLEAQEAKKKEILARAHLAASRTAAQNHKKQYAFGSSTPREISYLQTVPKDQRAYDKKLSPILGPAPPSPSNASPMRSSGAGASSAMTTSMYVARGGSPKASSAIAPAKRPAVVAKTVSETRPPRTSLMTQSLYATSTSSANKRVSAARRVLPPSTSAKKPTPNSLPPRRSVVPTPPLATSTPKGRSVIVPRRPPVASSESALPPLPPARVSTVIQNDATQTPKQFTVAPPVQEPLQETPTSEVAQTVVSTSTKGEPEQQQTNVDEVMAVAEPPHQDEERPVSAGQQPTLEQELLAHVEAQDHVASEDSNAVADAEVEIEAHVLVEPHEVRAASEPIDMPAAHEEDETHESTTVVSEERQANVESEAQRIAGEAVERATEKLANELAEAVIAETPVDDDAVATGNLVDFGTTDTDAPLLSLHDELSGIVAGPSTTTESPTPSEVEAHETVSEVHSSDAQAVHRDAASPEATTTTDSPHETNPRSVEENLDTEVKSPSPTAGESGNKSPPEERRSEILAKYEKEEQEREERKARLAAIMNRTRKGRQSPPGDESNGTAVSPPSGAFVQNGGGSNESVPLTALQRVAAMSGSSRINQIVQRHGSNPSLSDSGTSTPIPALPGQVSSPHDSIAA